jgi:hypothetical protein
LFVVPSLHPSELQLLQARSGLGIELNEEVVKQHLRESEHFAPTKEWDTERSHDRLWS